MRVKEESEKAGLKLNILKMEITASGPITSWQIEGEKVETVTDFIFMGSKNTKDGDGSHETKKKKKKQKKKQKKPLAPWKKNYNKPKLHVKK